MLKLPYYLISLPFSVILRPFTMTLFCYHNNNTNNISLLIISFRNNGCLLLKARISILPSQARNLHYIGEDYFSYNLKTGMVTPSFYCIFLCTRRKK